MKLMNQQCMWLLLASLYVVHVSGMPTVEVPQISPDSAMIGMPTVLGNEAGVPMQNSQDVAAIGALPQVPTVTPEGKIIQKDGSKKGQASGSSSEKKNAPSVLQLQELKFVDQGLKGMNNIINAFVGPFENFSEAIPPTVTSLFGPFAHVHWALIIRSLQRRVKKSRELFEIVSGTKKQVQEPQKKTEQVQKPVDFMTAMQEEVKKKEGEQKKKLALSKLMPKKVVEKIYQEVLDFTKKITHPLEKKSLAVAELFEPLPPIPFLVTISDVQLALNLLSLQQRMKVIEESLKNNLEPLDEIKKREKKNAVAIAELDPMVTMTMQADKNAQEQKKAEEKKKKEQATKSHVKLKETREVQSIYSAFKKLDTLVSSATKPIEKLAKDLPVMPVPLISFLGAAIALSSAPMLITGFLTGVGAIVAAEAAVVYGISQAQFAIYIRNLQYLVGKLEDEMKRYQDAKKIASKQSLEPAKMSMPQQDQQLVQEQNAEAPLENAQEIQPPLTEGIPSVMPLSEGSAEASSQSSSSAPAE